MTHRLFPLAVALTITIILIFLVQDFVREVIVAPLLYIFWISTLVVRSLPQAIFWIIFVLIGLVLALGSLGSGRTKRTGAMRAAPTSMGPVASWYRLIGRSQKQEFARWRLARELSQLYWSMLAPEDSYKSGFSLRSLERLDPNLPPQVAEYLVAGHQPHQPGVGRWRTAISKGQAAALDIDTNQVVEHLEALLESNAGESIHDNTIE